jgi:protein deglycase
MGKTAAVLLAEGFEEVEAITPIDYLRRAGIEVAVLGVHGDSAKGSHGIRVAADRALSDGEGLYDCLVVPGGPGAREMGKSEAVLRLVRAHAEAQRLVAAICAAPVVVLGPAGVLAARRFTCFPGMETELEALPGGATFVPGPRVLRDGPFVTSRAAGSSGEFAVEIVRALLGDEAAEKLAASVLARV